MSSIIIPRAWNNRPPADEGELLPLMNVNFDWLSSQPRPGIVTRGGSFYLPHRGPVLGFGIEIEIISIPLDEHVRNREEFQEIYRNMMVQKLSMLGEQALQDPNKEKGDIRKWFITTDASLKHTDKQVAFEANSPIFNSRDWRTWEQGIERFWKAVDQCDIDPGQNSKCGSHIHVAPFSSHPRIRADYNMEQLRSIAYAVLTQEWCVYRILPAKRQNNTFCPCNSKLVRHDTWGPTSDLAEPRSPGTRGQIFVEIQAIGHQEQLCQYMQGHRYALWNFRNTVQRRGSKPCTGTIEFRGGRHLRGKIMTKRWISFVIAFITMAIEKSNPNPFTDHRDMNQWWSDVKDQATEMKLGSLLPSNWEDMRNVNAPLWTEQTITRIKSDRSLRRAKEKADEEERARERANEEERAREEAIKEDRERNRAREEFEKAGRKRRAEEEAIQLDGERRRAEKRVEKAGRGKRAMEEAEKTAREKRAKEEAEKAKAKATQQLKDELRPIDTELTLQTDIGESKCAEYNKILSRRFVWRRKKKLRKLDEELREVVQEVNRLLEARKSKNDELLRAHALAISTTETGVGIIAFGAMTTVSRIQRLLT